MYYFICLHLKSGFQTQSQLARNYKRHGLFKNSTTQRKKLTHQPTFNSYLICTITQKYSHWHSTENSFSNRIVSAYLQANIWIVYFFLTRTIKFLKCSAHKIRMLTKNVSITKLEKPALLELLIYKTKIFFTVGFLVLLNWFKLI